MNIVPRISRAMNAGGRSALREREAVVLLRSSLDPAALLDHGCLLDFFSSLQLVLRLCSEVSMSSAGSLLATFDAERFAVLIMQQQQGAAALGGSSGDDVFPQAGGSSSSQGGSSINSSRTRVGRVCVESTFNPLFQLHVI
jgi:hypothetical protein